MSNEPSMEEILSSIKRIIAEEDIPSQAPRTPRRASMGNAPVVVEDPGVDQFVDDDQILELTDALPGETDADPVQEEPAMTVPANPAPAPKIENKPAKTTRARPAPASPEAPPAIAVMSDTSAEAARESLVNLSKLLLKPEDGQSNTLEGLVREMLRPMLKDWLDARLPDMVESLVKREIDRITGRV